MASRETNTFGAFAAKTHFSELLEKVAAGQEVTITKHGVPVARLVPIKPAATAIERRAAIDGIKQLSKGLSLGSVKIRDLIDEGRR